MNYKIIFLSCLLITNTIVCFGAEDENHKEISLCDFCDTELEKLNRFISLTPPSSFKEILNHQTALRLVEQYTEISPILFSIENPSGNTPLHIAASFGSEECLHLIFSKFKDTINYFNRDGYAPLHLAITCSNINAINILLFYGADINQYSQNGYTPLHLAIMYNKVEIVALLLKENAKINLQSKEGLTALEYAQKMLLHESDLFETHVLSFLEKHLSLNEEEESLFKQLSFKSKEKLINIMTECSLEYREIERNILESSEIEHHFKKTLPCLQKLKIINLVFESFALQERTKIHKQPDTRIRDMLNKRMLSFCEKE